MISKIVDTKDFGKVEVRTAMFESRTSLEEGIEIKGEEIGLIEVYGWRDILQLTALEVNNLIIQNKEI